MKVIGAGLPRTGTFSLCLALERIGFGPCHHMATLIEDPSSAPLWTAALAGGDLPHDHVSAVDFPACLLVGEFLARDPGLKVILTLRDPADWADSMAATVMADPGEVDPALTALVAASFLRLFGTTAPSRAELIAGFQRHADRIRVLVPPRQLLCYRVEEGWGPLCRFLGQPVPPVPFPRSNDRAAFARDNARMRG